MMALSALAGAQVGLTAEDRRGPPDAPKMDRWNIFGVQNHIFGTVAEGMGSDGEKVWGMAQKV